MAAGGNRLRVAARQRGGVLTAARISCYRLAVLYQWQWLAYHAKMA